jgi:hypothetical protein
MTHEAEYEVGKGKPPIASQFKKGQSGNPAGRPKGALGMSALINATLNEKVTVVVDGKRRTITKLQAAFTQQVNKAASGDRHATKLILQLFNDSHALEEARAANAPQDADERRATNAAMLQALAELARTIEPEADDVSEI